MPQLNGFLVTLFFAFLITACGGGGEGESVSTQPPLTSLECTNPHSADYPDEYNGQFSIPSPGGVLPAQISRGISFKDYSPVLLWSSLSQRGNCSRDEYVKLMYLQALQAMKATGAQSAWIYNYGRWSDGQEPWVVQESDYQIPKHYVEYIVEQANQLEIDIYFAWQFTTVNRRGEALVELGEHVSMEKLEDIMDAHHNNMIIQAQHAQSIGIKGIAADWNAMNIHLSSDEMKDYYIDRSAEIIDDIRAYFDGEIIWGQIGNVTNDERIFSRIDSLLVNAMNPGGSTQFTEEENANLTVELVKNKTLESLQGLRTQIYCEDPHQPCWHGKSDRELPVILNIQLQSRDDFFLEGWKEDGFCTPGTLENGTQVNCIQEHFITDFSVQAIGIEGIMQAIAEQDSFTIDAVDMHTSYWLSETLVPGTEGFPNISQSIRGKPAEDILKFWYTGQE